MGSAGVLIPLTGDPREPVTPPKRHKTEFNSPSVYDGVDNMKYAPQDAPPTADLMGY
jgi:hypothetical protein